VASGAVLLGLTGTLIGLGQSIVELSNSIPGDGVVDSTELIRSLGRSLDGMQTAFSTTLLGVLASLFVGLAIVAYTSKTRQLLLDLERALIQVWMPNYRVSETTIAKETLEKLGESKDALDTTLNSVRTSIDEAKEKFSDGFEELARKYTEETEGLVALFQQLQTDTATIIGSRSDDDESLAQIVADLQSAARLLSDGVQSTSSLIPDVGAELRHSLDAGAEAAREVLQRMSESTDVLLSDMGELFTQTIEENAAKSADLLETYHKPMADEVTKLAGAMDGLTAGVGQTTESVRRVAESVQDFTEAADRFEEIWSTVAKSVESAEVGIREGLDRALGQIREHVAGMSEDHALIRERVLSALRDYERQLESSLQTLQRERQQVGTRSNELVTELRDAIKGALLAIDRDSGAQNQAVIDAIIAGFERLSQELRDQRPAPQDDVLSLIPVQPPKPPERKSSEGVDS
jgi:uncharacterized phage infection (PIP) family protein YhgE